SAFADLNDDGFMDLVVTSLGERPRILLNSANNGHHWMLLDLQGHRSSRDAVGAMAKVTTASGRVLYNHVSPSVGFMSTSDRRVHFGLGEEDAVATVEIRWPSGAIQELVAPEVDRVITIAEPR
ncbi:MAG: CRTAC1 family protein, partial [Gemmatimonadetes bacterium]|nr:CRTAC1 family protein [Gemmatimonadota bacterium]